MTLTSLSYFVFLLICLLLYYCFKPIQKYILLMASIFFYFSISSNNLVHLIVLIVLYSVTTYCGGLLIEKVSGVKKKVILSICIFLLVSTLCILKYLNNIMTVISHLLSFSEDITFVQIGTIIGISYYTLSAIGYLVDVYWGNCQAGKNPFDVMLFVFYFPQLISGPLTRYSNIHPQFARRNEINYDSITLGIRRMIWGYFKKLVISERFAVVVSAVYRHYSDYSFTGILIATLCYAVQLYTDFSGCMDIIIGSSCLFGIELPENFNAPFFSETIKEFWQRWHISLGEWFKVFIMYPLQKSDFAQFFGSIARKRFGNKAGKKVPFYIAMAVLWVLIGIWHGGTAYYFVASAVIPFLLLIFSDILQKMNKKIVAALKINTKCSSWKWMRRIRTLLLVCICWFVVCSGNLHYAYSICCHMIRRLWNYNSFAQVIGKIGLNSMDIIIMTIGLVILFASDKLTYEGTTIQKIMDNQNLWIRILLICIEVLMIFSYGMVGNSSFIYFKF